MPGSPDAPAATDEQPPWRDLPGPDELEPSGWDALVETGEATIRRRC